MEHRVSYPIIDETSFFIVVYVVGGSKIVSVKLSTVFFSSLFV